MRPCLVAYVNLFLDIRVRHIYKMEKLDITAVIKYFASKEIHEDLLETLGKEPPSYSTVKAWASMFKRGRDRVEDDGPSGCPKDATADENVKVVHILVMCDKRLDLRSIVSELA